MQLISKQVGFLGNILILEQAFGSEVMLLSCCLEHLYTMHSLDLLLQPPGILNIQQFKPNPKFPIQCPTSNLSISCLLFYMHQPKSLSNIDALIRRRKQNKLIMNFYWEWNGTGLKCFKQGLIPTLSQCHFNTIEHILVIITTKRDPPNN